MIAGHHYVGPAADVWCGGPHRAHVLAWGIYGLTPPPRSLGVVLFAMTAGFLPFEHANTTKLYQKILRGDYTAPRFLSPQVPRVRVRVRGGGA